MANTESIFGAVSMGYVVVGSTKLEKWKEFAVEGLGLHLAHASTKELAFRLDDHARRIIVEHDASEDVTAVGWQLTDETVLKVVLDRLVRRGVDVDFIDDERAAQRGVESFHRFIGPKGFSLELFTTPLIDSTPLDMLTSGFSTGASGMGHLAIISREPARMLEFWQEVFDARISDRIEQSMGKTILDITFLRVNKRHHSVAIAATRGLRLDPLRTRVQHVNVEAASLDDLSAAYSRLKKLGYTFAHSVGQHPNDRELSFYVWTPSGFELEFGWDALAVNEDTWEEGITYPNISIWGHGAPRKFSNGPDFKQLKAGLMSLLKTEYFPWKNA